MSKFKRLPLHGNKLFKKVYTLDERSYLDFSELLKAVNEANNLASAQVELSSSYEGESQISVYGYVPASAEEVEYFEKVATENNRRSEEMVREQYEALKKRFEGSK